MPSLEVQQLCLKTLDRIHKLRQQLVYQEAKRQLEHEAKISSRINKFRKLMFLKPLISNPQTLEERVAILWPQDYEPSSGGNLPIPWPWSYRGSRNIDVAYELLDACKRAPTITLSMRDLGLIQD
jgi:hypothetical protein